MRFVRLGTAGVLGLIVAFLLLGANSEGGGPAKEGEQCAGFVGTLCDTGLVCEIPAGFCDAADMAGTCVKVPEVCTKEVKPVCDCKGKTHSNDCQRLMAGAQKDHDGACKEKD